MRILALTADLMFSSNIESTLRREGHEVGTIEDLTSLERELAADTDLVLLDLHSTVPAEAVVQICAGAADHVSEKSSRAPAVPVLAFGRHTEPQLLRAAREAGCVEAVPRSTFVEEMATLVEKAARSR